MFSTETKNIMRSNAYNTVLSLIEHHTPFRLVLRNNDDWNLPLPAHIMEEYPSALLLDIDGDTLESSYKDERSKIIIVADFGGESEHVKEVGPTDIIAVIKLNGSPIIINDFPPDNDESNDKYIFDNLVQELVLGGIPIHNINKSIKAFQNETKL